jgi:hypothetical protein
MNLTIDHDTLLYYIVPYKNIASGRPRSTVVGHDPQWSVTIHSGRSRSTVVGIDQRDLFYFFLELLTLAFTF